MSAIRAMNRCDPREPDLRHLRDEGLMRFVLLDGRERAVTLTEHGHHLLETHRRDRDDAREQAFYAGVSRPRELSHDAQLYGAYLREEERLLPCCREQLAKMNLHMHDLRRERAVGCWSAAPISTRCSCSWITRTSARAVVA